MNIMLIITQILRITIYVKMIINVLIKTMMLIIIVLILKIMMLIIVLIITILIIVVLLTCLTQINKFQAKTLVFLKKHSHFPKKP